MMDMTTVITTTTTNDDAALSLTQLLLILILLLIPLISLFMSQLTRQRQRGRQKEVVKEQLTLCQIVALMISIFFRIIFVILCYIVKYCLSSRIITTNNMVQIKVDWKRIVSFHSTSTSSSDCSSKQKEDKERREEPFLQIRFVHPCINSNNEEDEGKESFHLPQLSSFCLCIHTMGIRSFSTEYNYHGCNRSNTDVNTGEGSSNKASSIISIICRHLKVHMTITKEEEKGASNNYSKSLDMQFCIQETTTSLSPFPLWNIIHKTSSWFYKILQEKERKRLSSLSSFKMFFLKNIFHSIVIKDISISITENNLFQQNHNDLSPLLSSSFHNLCISCDQIKAVVNHQEVNDEGSKQSLSSLILETALENIRFQVHASTTAANIIRCTYCTSSTCINTTIYSTTTTNAHNDIQMEGNCIAIMVNEEDSNDAVPTDNEYFTNIIYFLAVDHINVSISEKTTGLISSATINNINIYEKEILHVQEEEQDHFFTTTSRSDTLFLSLVQNEMSNYTQPSFSSSLFATKMTSSNNNNFPIVKFNGIINVELEKTIEEEERDSSSSTNISLNIYTVSNTNNRSGDSSSGIDIHWSPMLHIELLRIISFIQQDIQHSITTVRTSFTATSLTKKKNQQKHSKKNIISTINLFNGDNNKNNLNVTVWGVEAGGGKGNQEISNSLMNITCTSIHCILNIEKIQEKGEKKPHINKSIQLKCNRVKIKLLNEELDIFCIRNIFFSFKTITTTTTTSSNSVRAELSKEEFVVLNVEKIIFRLPHKLHFGQVQKDILMIPKVIKQQQSALLLQQQKHQLQSSKAAVAGITMNIRSCISQVDIAFLPPLPRSPLQHHLTSNTATDQFLFRTLLHKTKVEIQRDNDSNGNNNTVQRHLQTLDGNSSSSLSENNGDDSNNVLYCGVQGGYVKLKISRAVILLDCPSTANNILTPLTVIDRGLGWNGYFFLAQAQAQKKRNDSDNNQTQQRTMNYTSVILSRSFQRITRRTRKVQKVNIYSHGIPMKVYMDGNLLLNKISTSLGKSILKISIPMLNEAIKRMLPPATPHAQKEENKASSSPPSGLSWWDNVRYMIHGKIRIQAKSFSFRWLLEDDSILCNNTYEWSLLTNIDKLDLKYSLGRVKVKIEYFHLSLPGQAYKRDMKTNATKTSSATAEEAKDSHNDDNNNRQSLLLIPNLELLLDFQWHLLNPQTLITPQSHHVPYLNYDDSTTLAMKQNLEKDKFFYFRSCGIHIQGNLKLMTTTSPHKSNIMKNNNKETGVAYYANWIALRMDTLPWLTHQQKKQQPCCLNKKKDPQEESNTRPKPTIATTSTNDPSNSDSTSQPQQQQQQQNFPIIESLSVSLSANDIQMALWHGSLLKNENDRRKIPSTSNNKENNYSSDRGLLFKIGNLLVNYEATLSSSSSLSDDDSRIMGRCARKLVPKSTRIEMLGHFHVTLLDLMKKRKQSSPLNNSAVGTIEVPSSSSSSMVRITRTETQHAMANKFDQLSQFCNLLGKDVSNDKNVSSSPPPPRRHESYSSSSGTIFDILQKWSSETISASDYIVEADNIVIMDTQISDDYLPPSSLRHFQSKREDSSSYQHTSNLLRPSLYDFRKNHLLLNPTTANHHYNIIDNNKSEKDKKKKPSKHTASVASKVEERHTSCDAGKNKKTWTVLVSCMKLLWTLEIRDVLYKLIGDQLLETINFMVVQLKEDGSNPGDDSMEEEEDAGYSDKKATSSTVTKTSFHIPDPNKEQLKEEEEETTPTTNLMYLLRRTGSGVSYASDDDFRSIRQNSLSSTSSPSSTMTKPSPTSDHNKQKRKTKSIIDKDSTFYDIVDIHLYNPQIQLHSESTTTTGGSILLAMKGVYIKGKSYSKLFMIDSSSDSSFLRQSEFQYVLQSVQGFASPGGIDLSSGLQWLNLVSIAKEEEKEESKESEEGDSSFFTTKQDNFILGNQQTLGSLRDLIPSSNSPIEELLSPLKKCKGRNNKEDPPYYRPFLHHHHHHQEKERSMKDYFKEFSKEKVFETTHLFRKILDPFNFRTIQVCKCYTSYLFFLLLILISQDCFYLD